MSQVLPGKLFKDLSAALEALPAAFVLYDADEKIVICNDSYRREYRPFEHVVQPGVSHTELQWLKVKEGLDSNAAGREEDFVREEQIRHRTGPEVEEWQDDHGRFIRLLRARLPDGNVVGMRFDITDLRVAQEELKARNGELEDARARLAELANHDELTGLPNRRAANAKLEEIASMGVAQNQSLVILQIDLDGFKRVNDEVGHDAGDHVLKEVSKRLEHLVPDGEMLFRIGGDEFQIILCGIHRAADALALANCIVQSVSSPFIFKGRTCHIGASVGIAVAKGATTSIDDLAKQADIALYKSKRSGRGCVSVFSKDMASERERDRQIANALRGSKRAHSIEMEFLPIVSATDRSVAALDIRSSLAHPKLGTLPFSDILPIADGLDAGGWLSLDAMRCFLDWHASLTDEGFPTAFLKVSEQALVNPKLLDILAKSNVPSEGLILCVEEEKLRVLDFDSVSWQLEAVREKGVGICFDGIGARTTIGALQTFRPDILSLSSNVIGSLVADPDAQDVLRLISAQARVLGAKVLARGLNQKAQAKSLADMGCTLLQGSFLADPFPASSYSDVLQRGKARRQA